MKKTIAAIVAHADDLEYGMGGTFAKYIHDGYEGLYGMLSRCNSGWTKEAGQGHYAPSCRTVPQRRAEAEAAAKVFGSEFYCGDLLENCHTLKDGTRITFSYQGPVGIGATVNDSQIDEDEVLDATPLSIACGVAAASEDSPAVQEVADLLVKWQPSLVLGQGIGNVNLDHFAAALLVAVAWQIASTQADIGPYWIPVWPHRPNSRRFPPLQANRFVEVTGHEDTALEALACHKSQGCDLDTAQDRVRRKWQLIGDIYGVTSAEAFCEVYPHAAELDRSGVSA